MAITFTKTIGKLKLVQLGLAFLPEPDNCEDVMPQRSFDRFEAASMASLAALIVGQCF